MSGAACRAILPRSCSTSSACVRQGTGARFQWLSVPATGSSAGPRPNSRGLWSAGRRAWSRAVCASTTPPLALSSSTLFQTPQILRRLPSRRCRRELNTVTDHPEARSLALCVLVCDCLAVDLPSPAGLPPSSSAAPLSFRFGRTHTQLASRRDNNHRPDRDASESGDASPEAQAGSGGAHDGSDLEGR